MHYLLPILLFCVFFIYLTYQQTCDFDSLDVVTDLLPKDCYQLDIANDTYYYYSEKECFPSCEPYPASGKFKYKIINSSGQR